MRGVVRGIRRRSPAGTARVDGRFDRWCYSRGRTPLLHPAVPVVFLGQSLDVRHGHIARRPPEGEKATWRNTSAGAAVRPRPTSPAARSSVSQRWWGSAPEVASTPAARSPRSPTRMWPWPLRTYPASARPMHASAWPSAAFACCAASRARCRSARSSSRGDAASISTLSRASRAARMAPMAWSHFARCSSLGLLGPITVNRIAPSVSGGFARSRDYGDVAAPVTRIARRPALPGGPPSAPRSSASPYTSPTGNSTAAATSHAISGPRPAAAGANGSRHGFPRTPGPAGPQRPTRWRTCWRGSPRRTVSRRLPCAARAR